MRLKCCRHRSGPMRFVARAEVECSFNIDTPPFLQGFCRGGRGRLPKRASVSLPKCAAAEFSRVWQWKLPERRLFRWL
jgi:hypothetical protein